MRLLNRHKSSYFGIDYNYEPDIMMWFGTDFKELFEKNYDRKNRKNAQRRGRNR